MEAQVLKALHKLRKLCPRTHREVRDCIDATILIFEKQKDPATPSTLPIPFEPFLLAILTRSAKLVASSLDTIEKFLAFGFLQNDALIPESIRKRVTQKSSISNLQKPRPFLIPETTQAEESSVIHQENWKLMDYIIQIVCDCMDHGDENVQLQILRVLLTAVTTSACHVHEQSLLKAIRACYHLHLVSKSTTNQTIAKATLQQIIAFIFQRMENLDLQHPIAKAEGAREYNVETLYSSVAELFHFYDGSTASSQSSFPSVFHKDAFLLFRSLCRISMRSVAEDAGNANGSGNGPPNSEDPFAFQSKMLSLELILSIINHAGPSFKKRERFIHAIRQYLCQSLLQNCTSNYTLIVGLSLQVFLVLIHHFKRHLKAEIEIFITSIFLRLLQSENSSFEHKMLVLEVLNSVCDDAAILGEIFLNYDCDYVSSDLFRQIIDVLAKITKGKSQREHQASYGHLSSSARQKMIQNDAALVVKGLECLTATVASLKRAANLIEKESTSKTIGESQPALQTPLSVETEDLILPVPIASMGSNMSAIEAFDRKKKKQEEIATGIFKFNVKASAGIQYLIEHNHIRQASARDVALFLHTYNVKLDKTELGEYLGREHAYQNGFCIKVLHEFVDCMDFTNLEIDLAIRHFLSKFRLPGESQKIDRIMEKFAERYYQTCAASSTHCVFPSADTAFILSFSIIMLQTDLHNPSVAEEKKMDKAGFIRNNRGINNGEDLPEEYLSGIYDRIKATPISLKEDDDFKARSSGQANSGVTTGAASTISAGSKRGISTGGSSSFFGASSAVNDRWRRDAYIQEREAMMRQSTALFKRRHPSAIAPDDVETKPVLSKYHVITELVEPCHVRPMFATIWAPLLACSSVIFESSDAPVAIQLCLNSFKHAIHLAARLEMPSERDAFVTVLAKFTALHTIESRLIRPKNVEAIKALISISVKEGNYLMDAWRDILQCISQLAKIQLHAQGLGSDTEFFGSPSASRRSTAANISHSSTSLFSSASNLSPNTAVSQSPGSSINASATGDDSCNIAIENGNAARILMEIDALASDRVFSSSATLTDRAVQEFIQQLCVVSLSECSGISNNRVAVMTPRPGPDANTTLCSPPRVFSLQKLVEVADMNMHTRSRVVWANMWKVLSRHFTTIGCHENLSVAMYAIDSLKQLSMKFLEREELRDFNFQRLFLTPFEVIIANAINLEIRELVLRCVENMILARVGNIKSGWKTIWNVLRIAAETYEPIHNQSEHRIVLIGFHIVKCILSQHFGRIHEVFVDAVECLVAFAVCGNENDVEQKQIERDRVLRQLTVDCIDLLQNVCFHHLADGKLLALEPIGKRVGFGKKQTGVENKQMRYDKQESTQNIHDEVDSKSLLLSPAHRKLYHIGAMELEYVFTDSAAHTRLWWPVLTAMSTLAADRRSDVRYNALYALFDSLRAHGSKFSCRLYSLIFKGILIPLLQELRRVEELPGLDTSPLLSLTSSRCQKAKESNAKAREEHCLSPTATRVVHSSTIALERILDIYGAHYHRIGFLPDVVFLLGNCMDTCNEKEEELAMAAAASFEQMLLVHGSQFPEDVWGLIADELRALLTRVQPLDLISSMNGDRQTLVIISMYPSVVATLRYQFSASCSAKADNLNASVPSQIHLAIFLALQKTIGRVLTAAVQERVALSPGHTVSLLQCLKESFHFATQFNDATALRSDLAAKEWWYGTEEHICLPNLLLQEVQGKMEYVNVLIERILRGKLSCCCMDYATCREEYVDLIRKTLVLYLQWNYTCEHEAKRDAEAQIRIERYRVFIIAILKRMSGMPEEELMYAMSRLYTTVSQLITVPDRNVRSALSDVFQYGLVQLLPFDMK